MMKTFSKVCLLSMALFAASSCSKEERTAEALRGTIVSAELIGAYSPAQVDSVKASLGAAALNIIVSQYGVEIYKITYNTIDPEGRNTLTAGALVLPLNVPTPLPLTEYMHGTITEKSGAPSAMGYEIVIGLLMSASQGFAVCMPDYLGFSEGPGTYDRIHPYIHAKSEASASIDMIRAARNFVADNPQFSLNDQLFLTGYSQGGHACMATVKEIETYHSSEFTITAAYPMAGPYNLSGAQSELIEQDGDYDAPYYLPFITLGYNDIYHVYGSPAEFMKPEYATVVPPLYDGYHGGGEMNAVLPSQPKDMFLPEIFESFQNNPNDKFRSVLRLNNLDNFVPKSPMRMCHCQSDQLVNFANSVVAHDNFVRWGRADIQLNNPGNNYSHQDCAVPCLVDAFIWFVSLKN